MIDKPQDFGPPWPDLGARVARLRHGDDRKAHGLAVLEGIRALQRSALRRQTPTHNVDCASRTNYNDGPGTTVTTPR